MNHDSLRFRYPLVFMAQSNLPLISSHFLTFDVTLSMSYPMCTLEVTLHLQYNRAMIRSPIYLASDLTHFHPLSRPFTYYNYSNPTVSVSRI